MSTCEDHTLPEPPEPGLVVEDHAMGGVVVEGFTLEQYRQGQFEAIAAFETANGRTCASAGSQPPEHEDCDEVFLVLNIDGLACWPARYGRHKSIPAGRRPTVLHTTHRSAAAEAERLTLTTGGKFLVFTSTDLAVRVNVPTHVSMNGVVLLSQTEVRLASIDNGIPF